MNKDIYSGKKILVTGGGGSIGSVLVRELLKMHPAILRVLDSSEFNLYQLERQFGHRDELRLLLGDIRDENRVIMAMEGIDIVFHVAALKHVPICEYNPFEAVKTNIIGTQNIIDAALKCNIDRFVTISTDKAAAPVNVMGVSKLIAEKLTIAANRYRGYKLTKFSCVRFGNVLGSNGSVLPAFVDMILNKHNIEITDPDMTRFLMRISDAVKLIINAVSDASGGEIFILKMQTVVLRDLAKAIIEVVCEMHNIDPSTIEIKYIGRRAGEKNHEELFTIEEFQTSYIFLKDNVYVIIPKNLIKSPEQLNIYKGESIVQIKEYSSHFNSSKAESLDFEELKTMIKSELI